MILTYLRTAYEFAYARLMVHPRLHAAAVALLIAFCIGLFAPLSWLQNPVLIAIGADMTMKEAAETLEREHVTLSGGLVTTLARVTGTDTSLQAGRYLFTGSESAFGAWYRLTNGVSGIRAVRVTFPEGMTVREMGDIL